MDAEKVIGNLIEDFLTEKKKDGVDYERAVELLKAELDKLKTEPGV